VKVSDNGRRIETAKVTVCVVCGYRIDERHCLGHSLREPNPAHAMTREVYLSEYVPPPYVKVPRRPIRTEN
jgi:hypothetical protein